MFKSHILTIEDCEEIALKTGPDKKVKSFRISPFSKPLDGLVGEHFTLEITYENDEKMHFFVKYQSSNRVLHQVAKSANMYRKEEYFYGTVLEELRAEYDTSFVPKSYLIRDSLVVLQDLQREGYSSLPKRISLNLDQCRICLRTLARFHAVGYQFCRNHQGTIHTLDVLQDKFLHSPEINGATKYLQASIKGLIQLANYVGFPQEFQDKLQSIVEQAKNSIPTQSPIDTILHGDVWTSNFLLSHTNITDCKLIDFQTIKLGPPQFDLMQFLFTNTRRRFRQINQTDLIQFYYESLVEYLQTEIPITMEDFLKSCPGKFEIPMKIVAIIDRSVTFLSDGIFAKALETDESFREFLHEDRGRFIIEGYDTDREFRELLLEDLHELNEMLSPHVQIPNNYD